MKRYVILNNDGRRICSIEAERMEHNSAIGYTLLYANGSIVSKTPIEMSVIEWNESYAEFETYTARNVRELSEMISTAKS
jgi:hypothetical protein